MTRPSEIRVEDDIVPLPYGKLIPDLRGCNYINEPEPKCFDKILCPNCGSDNVVGLSPAFNPEVDDVVEGFPSWGRWFCISCHDSWRYGLEK